MSINNKRSYTEYTVTQPTTDFAIGFDDYDEGVKDNILVTLNGVLVESLGYTAIRKNESTVTITPAITEGTVRLTRETDIDEPFHKFTAGALFSAKSMDENFQQVRNSQQEVRDGFEYLEFNTSGIVSAAKTATNRANDAADVVEGLTTVVNDKVSAVEDSQETTIQRVDNFIASDVVPIVNDAISNMGFITIDSFELGATLTQRNQALRHAADGKLYRWAGNLPKSVPESSTPTSSGGIGTNAWLEVSDTVLRQELNSSGGVTKVKGAAIYVDDYAGLKSEPAYRTNGTTVTVLDTFRGGVFSFSSQNLSAEVANDALEGIYVAATGDGTDGAFVRQVPEGDYYKVSWFGAEGLRDIDATNAIFECFKHAMRFDNVRVDFVGGSHKITVPTDEYIAIRNKKLVSIKPSGATIFDDTTYNASESRKFIMMSNTRNIETVGFIKVIGNYTPLSGEGDKGTTFISCKNCHNINASVDSEKIRTGLEMTRTTTHPYSTNLVANLISDNNHYGGIFSNVVGHDIKINANGCYRSFICDGLQSGNLHVISTEQKGRSLIKHYTPSLQTADCKIYASFEKGLPFDGNTSACSIELQSSNINPADFKNVEIDLTVINNAENPYTGTLFGLANYTVAGGAQESGVNHAFTNVVIKGLLLGKGLASTSIVFPVLGSFVGTTAIPTIRDLVTDTDLDAKPNELFILNNVKVKGSVLNHDPDYFSKVSTKVTAVNSNVSGTTPIFKAKGSIRGNFKLNLSLLASYAAPSERYIRGTIEGYWYVSTAGTMRLTISRTDLLSDIASPETLVTLTLEFVGGTAIMSVKSPLHNETTFSIAQYEMNYQPLVPTVSGLITAYH